MRQRNLGREVRLLQALADENRLRILGCLLVRSACVCELVEATGLSQPRISRHLRTLRDAGLVRDRRDAQWVEYSLAEFADGSPEAEVLGAAERLLAGHPQGLADRKRLSGVSRALCVPK